MLKVLYDGWPLVAAPDSPASLHLLELLAAQPAGVSPALALPDAPPTDLPAGLEIHVQHTPLTPGGARRWLQRALPDFQRQSQAAVLHTAQSAAPLFPAGPVVVSPCGFGPEERPPSGFHARLGAALGAGGMSRAHVLWPDDTTTPATIQPARSIPAATPAVFHPAHKGQRPPFDLPEDYILCQVPANPALLNRVLSAWSWAHGPLGADSPLVLLGLDAYGRAYAETILKSEDMQSSVRVLPPTAPAEAAAVYRGCRALFHPAGPGGWCSPVRLALACGKPVIGANRPDLAELVGPAGFLIEEDDARHLGGGLIAVLVKDAVRRELEEKAAVRAAAWQPAAFADALARFYQSLR